MKAASSNVQPNTKIGDIIKELLHQAFDEFVFTPFIALSCSRSSQFIYEELPISIFDDFTIFFSETPIEYSCCDLFVFDL